MTGCLDYNVFAALLDGTASTTESQQARAHIPTCPECRVMAQDLGYEVPPDPALAATAAGSGDDHPALSSTDAAAEEDVPRNTPGAAEPLIGRLIAGYRVKREIGSGGMGAVYEAVHERMGQRAAVKFMFPQFSADRNFMRRFRAEARAASVVRHPGLVTIFNYGKLPDGTAYIMMEYLEGDSLRRRLIRKRQDVTETLRLARQIASALCAVHENGIVHRDLKPDNIMIVPDADLPGGERAKIVDFGIAKIDSAPATNPSSAGAITGQRAFIGTVAYASPEQCRMSTSLDGKSDVYSLGVILYEMLSGDIPFSGNISEVLDQHATLAPQPLRDLSPSVSSAVATLVHDMLAKQPQQRPTMARVRERIDLLTATQQKAQTRLPLFIGGAVLALLGTVAGVLHFLGHL